MSTQGWLPIETAPKDGSEILATGHNYGAQEKGRHYAVVKFKGSGWVCEAEHSDFGHSHLTHWQHLPAPPEQEPTNG
jgi:hypothetical protein